MHRLHSEVLKHLQQNRGSTDPIHIIIAEDCDDAARIPDSENHLDRHIDIGNFIRLQ